MTNSEFRAELQQICDKLKELYMADSGPGSAYRGVLLGQAAKSIARISGKIRGPGIDTVKQPCPVCGSGDWSCGH